MGIIEWKECVSIRGNGCQFSSYIMAALVGADTLNAEKIRRCWPEIYEETSARYNAPGGYLTEREVDSYEKDEKVAGLIKERLRMRNERHLVDSDQESD